MSIIFMTAKLSSKSQASAETDETRIVTVRNIDQVLRWWGFFNQGLELINRETGWGERTDDFFRVLCHALKLGTSKSQILIQLGKDGTPLGYLIAVDNSTPYGLKSALIYAVYSNKLCPSTFMELVAEVTQWAKFEGYKQVQACSYRLNRTSVKLFSRYLNDKKFMVFSKIL